MASQKNAAEPEVRAEPIRIEVLGESAVLHLEGVVGVMQSKRLQRMAIELAGAGRGVTVQCEHLQQFDCASVQVLLALHETLKGKGIGMKMENMPDSVFQTLRTVGLASAF
jgi:anti-anti-sigma factor